MDLTRLAVDAGQFINRAVQVKKINRKYMLLRLTFKLTFANLLKSDVTSLVSVLGHRVSVLVRQ